MVQNLSNGEKPVDQLIFVVVSDEQAGALGKKLVADGFRFTIISASNGLLPAGTTCLLLGIHSAGNPRLMSLIESVCRTRRTYIPAQGQGGQALGLPPFMFEAEVGSADIFILGVEHYEAF